MQGPLPVSISKRLWERGWLIMAFCKRNKKFSHSVIIEFYCMAELVLGSAYAKWHTLICY